MNLATFSIECLAVNVMKNTEIFVLALSFSFLEGEVAGIWQLDYVGRLAGGSNLIKWEKRKIT